MDFCESAKAWLDMHEDNVVSLHCKAGKGRAGIMAACLMVRLGETASASVSKFDEVKWLLTSWHAGTGFCAHVKNILRASTVLYLVQWDTRFNNVQNERKWTKARSDRRVTPSDAYMIPNLR